MVEETYFHYNTKLNIKVGEEVLPDPSEWTYQVGDLDTSGSRDATGLLHRAYVATKINYEFKWNAIEWKVLARILEVVNAKPKFTLIAPDPRDFKGRYKGRYYVGDRQGKNHYYLPERPEVAVFDLKLKFIEY